MKLVRVEVELFEVSYEWTRDPEEEPETEDNVQVRAGDIKSALDMADEHLGNDREIKSYYVTGATRLHTVEFIEEE